jgi:hypothetical protein
LAGSSEERRRGAIRWGRSGSLEEGPHHGGIQSSLGKYKCLRGRVDSGDVPEAGYNDEMDLAIAGNIEPPRRSISPTVQTLVCLSVGVVFSSPRSFRWNVHPRHVLGLPSFTGE